jgi:C-terminal processing protease CtpA/Prc
MKLWWSSPIEDTPAFESGIRSKDVIPAIDGESTEGMDLKRCRQQNSWSSRALKWC